MMAHSNTDQAQRPGPFQFLHEPGHTPDAVGEGIDDADRVRACLTESIEYYHDTLTATTRAHITEKWGLTDSIIDARKIGYVDDTNSVITHLQDAGYDPLTIIRAGLGTAPLIKHIYTCQGEQCSHTVPDPIDELATARRTGVIEPEHIDLEAVVDYVEASTHTLSIWNWWSNRLVFAYQNESREYCYLIGRETPDTDDIDNAKYIKQTIDRDWINHDVISEPIFGVETVEEGKPLIVTEGITDTLMAHQHGFPCVAPATTSFKPHHYEQICTHAETASAVFVVNDTDGGPGINGALRTAKIIQNDGHTARVGELPKPAAASKIDLAEFLHQKDSPHTAFKDVLAGAIPPEAHVQFSPERHDPSHTAPRNRSNYTPTDTGTEEVAHDADVNIEYDDDSVSALYSLTLRDVVDVDALEGVNTARNTIYRGVNPLGHHGNSTGYFRIRDNGEFLTAKDFKIESTNDGYYYNALTWLACEASCNCDSPRCGCTRSTSNPSGSLSNSEVWWAWHHAKTSGHVSFPADDPVPIKAIWFLAGHHDLFPQDSIPEGFDDRKRLPKTVFNRVLDLIESEYGVNPGRDRRTSEPRPSDSA